MALQKYRIKTTFNKRVASIEDIDAPLFNREEGYHPGWIPQSGNLCHCVELRPKLTQYLHLVMNQHIACIHLNPKKVGVRSKVQNSMQITGGNGSILSANQHTSIVQSFAGQAWKQTFAGPAHPQQKIRRGSVSG
jgi:hypothetical protein